MSTPGTRLAVVDHDWRMRAACRATGPDLFFPVGTTDDALEQLEAARAVCRVCPVRIDCLEFALTTNQDAGIWGGTSEGERRKLHREGVAQRKAAAALAHS